MKSLLFILYLGAGFILECNATSTINWNMKDKTINKSPLCEDENCKVKANHEVIITVTWFFEGSIHKPSVTLEDKQSLLHGSPTTVVYNLCHSQTGSGIAIMIKECKFTLSGGNHTFDLPVFKSSSQVGAKGTIYTTSSNGAVFWNNVVIRA